MTDHETPVPYAYHRVRVIARDNSVLASESFDSYDEADDFATACQATHRVEVQSIPSRGGDLPRLERRYPPGFGFPTHGVRRG